MSEALPAEVAGLPQIARALGKVVIVSSLTEAGATPRLISMPLHRGLAYHGVSSSYLRPESARTFFDDADCVVFHYEDLVTIELLREAFADGVRIPVACLGSDIYYFDEYTRVHDLVTFYLVPTDLHRMVLSSQVHRPVYTFPEAIDQAARGDSPTFQQFPEKTNRRICWFGYSESFDKGMASLLPVINAAIDADQIDSFEAILDESKFRNNFAVKTRLFEHEKFRTMADDYDYVVLSHFALDLSLNSLIKSPNKAISSLMAGLIPLATDTPSYGKLFRELGIERFLFSSPQGLRELLGRLDPVEDSRVLRDLGVIDILLERFSDIAHAQRFTEIFDRALMVEQQLDLQIGVIPPEPPSEYTLGWLLRNLVPSAARAVRNRARKLSRRRLDAVPDGL